MKCCRVSECRSLLFLGKASLLTNLIRHVATDVRLPLEYVAVCFLTCVIVKKRRRTSRPASGCVVVYDRQNDWLSEAAMLPKSRADQCSSRTTKAKIEPPDPDPQPWKPHTKPSSQSRHAIIRLMDSSSSVA